MMKIGSRFAHILEKRLGENLSRLSFNITLGTAKLGVTGEDRGSGKMGVIRRHHISDAFLSLAFFRYNPYVSPVTPIFAVPPDCRPHQASDDFWGQQNCSPLRRCELRLTFTSDLKVESHECRHSD